MSSSGEECKEQRSKSYTKGRAGHEGNRSHRQDTFKE